MQLETDDETYLLGSYTQRSLEGENVSVEIIPIGCHSTWWLGKHRRPGEHRMPLVSCPTETEHCNTVSQPHLNVARS